MIYSTLIDELTKSYSRQIDGYTLLKTIGQKILGRIALSRGDLAGVLPLFEEKQKILEIITKERENIKEYSEKWQKEKKNIPQSESTQKLDTILEQAQQAILLFLQTEEQLAKFIAGLSKKENNIEQ